MLDDFGSFNKYNTLPPESAPITERTPLSFAGVAIGTTALRIVCRRAYKAESLAATARHLAVSRQQVYRVLDALRRALHVDTREEALAGWRARFGP